MSYQVDGKTIEHDEEGYLTDINQWTEPLGTVIAEKEGLDLSAEHWEVVNFLREVLCRVPDRARHPRADQGDHQAPRRREGQQQVSVRTVPVWSRQAGVQDRRAAEADRLRLGRNISRTA